MKVTQWRQSLSREEYFNGPRVFKNTCLELGA